MTGSLITEQGIESEVRLDSHNANVLICSGSVNNVVKEVAMEAESHPVMAPPVQIKDLFNFSEISRELYHAEKKIVARRSETKTRKFEGKQGKQEIKGRFVAERVTETDQTHSDSCNANFPMIKEESNPVIVPPGENKALYDFTEISRALSQTETEVVALVGRLKTKRREMKRRQRKQEMFMERIQNVDRESFPWIEDFRTFGFWILRYLYLKSHLKIQLTHEQIQILVEL